MGRGWWEKKGFFGNIFCEFALKLIFVNVMGGGGGGGGAREGTSVGHDSDCSLPVTQWNGVVILILFAHKLAKQCHLPCCQTGNVMIISSFWLFSHLHK